MHLDMHTMSAVSVAVTAVLGGVLLFTWARERESPLVGWWGLALMIQATGVALSAAASPVSSGALLGLGGASIILGCGIKWKAAREFAYRQARLLWVILGPVGYLLAAQSGYLQSFDYRLAAVCTILSVYDFAAATELARCNGERLPSRWPAVALLVVTGLSYLSWLPLNLAMPISRIAMGGRQHLVPDRYPLHASAPGRSRLHRDVDGQGAPRDGAARRGLDRRVNRPSQPPRFVRGGRRA